MYRVCLQGAEPTELECETLEQACAAVRAKFGDFEVLPGADEQFWVCCQNINESDSEVVARIYLEGTATRESPPLTGGGLQSRDVKETVKEELERAPASGERSTPASDEAEVRSRRTPTG